MSKAIHLRMIPICILVAALALAAGCDGGNSGPLEGHEGGPCTADGLCLAGLSCVDAVCVEPADCATGTADCDGDPANGCETALGTTSDCAACADACAAAHGTPACTQGSCTFACEVGFDDCDTDPSNGCETPLDSLTDCGACDAACQGDRASGACVDLACVLTCDAGFDDCDTDPANGCETPLDTLTDCGACDEACQGDHASGACVDLACVLTCDTGFDDCDGDPANGCETPLDTLTDCGACDAACQGDHGTGACVDLACVFTCDAGFDNCDVDPANGCETPLDTMTDCGACAAVCGDQNATAACQDLACVQTCDNGYDDCDGDLANGCEADLASTEHCGACGQACSQNNATAACVADQCELTCDPGFEDCDGDASNGCEADLTANPNCGACGILCAGACNGGACEVCDTNLVINSADPMDAARAIGLCAGVVSAHWVYPDGTAAGSSPNYDLGHGILNGFGANVNVQHGSKLLALSSGTARQPSDPGFSSPSGFDKGYTTGAPLGFPKESPACPSVLTGDPHDGVGLEVTLQVPTNALGFSYRLDFYTYEWPTYVCSPYNDFFVANLVPLPQGQTDGNIAFDSQGNPISVNAGYFEICTCPSGPPCTAGGLTYSCALGPSELSGTGFEDHAATGWLINQAPAEPDTTITLRFTIYDSGDGVLDSTVLIDKFQWLGDPTSVGTEPDPDPL